MIELAGIVHREQRENGGESSEPIRVLSGVPQGSVLGPLLFLIYVDDVTTCNLSVGSKLSLYADDMLLYKHVDAICAKAKKLIGLCYRRFNKHTGSQY